MRHPESPDLSAVPSPGEQPDLFRARPEAILYAILDRVVDGYLPVVAGLENDIDEIETEVFGSDPGVSRRIYELTREVIEFQRATRPLAAVLAALTAGFDKYGTDEELQRYLRDVEDHLTVIEQVDGFPPAPPRHLHQKERDAFVAQRQNEEMRAPSEASIDRERGTSSGSPPGGDPLPPPSSGPSTA